MILIESCVMGHAVLMIEMFTNLITVAIFPLFVAFGLNQNKVYKACLNQVTSYPGKVTDNFLVWYLCYS